MPARSKHDSAIIDLLPSPQVPQVQMPYQNVFIGILSR